MEETRLSFLFDLYFEDQTTVEQEDEFFALAHVAANKNELEQLMEKRWSNFNSTFQPFDFQVKSRILNAIYDHAEIPALIVSPKKLLWSRVAIAATITAVIFTAGLFYYPYNKNQRLSPQAAKRNDTVVPGRTGATLTLANGKKIRLTDAVNGELAKESGVVITKSSDGQLVYEIKGESASEQLNTLSTANGENYKVLLPDGSLIWLNAASSLTYTTTLIANGKRRVKLNGEGYFEIAKDLKHPFVVESKGQEVEVLGTHFNVNGYADENVVKTTLIEGVVRINGSTYLKPGQQSLLSGGYIKLTSVDTDAEIAWKNGKFSFTGRDFKSIMRSISRWYNVDVVYDYEPINLHIAGGISRFENINDVLERIQNTGDVKFKIEGRRIRVIK